MYKYLLLPIVMTAIPFTALAETTYAEIIYKTVDENGAPVFSDKRMPGAEKIIVEPNVIDVDIPDMPLHTAPTSHPKVMHTGTHKNLNNNQIIESGYGYGASGNLKRKIRNITNGEGIKHPVTRPIAKPVARTGGHR